MHKNYTLYIWNIHVTICICKGTMKGASPRNMDVKMHFFYLNFGIMMTLFFIRILHRPTRTDSFIKQCCRFQDSRGGSGLGRGPRWQMVLATLRSSIPFQSCRKTNIIIVQFLNLSLKKRFGTILYDWLYRGASNMEADILDWESTIYDQQ